MNSTRPSGAGLGPGVLRVPQTPQALLDDVLALVGRAVVGLGVAGPPVDGLRDAPRHLAQTGDVHPLGVAVDVAFAEGVAVVGVTTVRVFLFDTQGLDTIARTISFLVFGAILLTASNACACRPGDRPLDRLTEI